MNPNKPGRLLLVAGILFAASAVADPSLSPVVHLPPLEKASLQARCGTAAHAFRITAKVHVEPPGPCEPDFNQVVTISDARGRALLALDRDPNRFETYPGPEGVPFDIACSEAGFSLSVGPQASVGFHVDPHGTVSVDPASLAMLEQRARGTASSPSVAAAAHLFEVIDAVDGSDVPEPDHLDEALQAARLAYARAALAAGDWRTLDFVLQGENDVPALAPIQAQLRAELASRRKQTRPVHVGKLRRIGSIPESVQLLPPESQSPLFWYRGSLCVAQVIMREFLDQGSHQPPIPARCYDPVRGKWGPVVKLPNELPGSAIVSLNGHCTTWVNPVGADDQWTGYDGTLVGTSGSTVFSFDDGQLLAIGKQGTSKAVPLATVVAAVRKGIGSPWLGGDLFLPGGDLLGGHDAYRAAGVDRRTWHLLDTPPTRVDPKPQIFASPDARWAVVLSRIKDQKTEIFLGPIERERSSP